MNRELGVTLFSLLVGTLVSAIVVIAMMMTYRAVVQTAAPASDTARRDGERIAALLSAHMMLHDAGFGIDSADPDIDLVVLNNASLSGQALTGTPLSGTSRKGNAIVWRKQLDTNGDGEPDTSFCEVLLANSQGGLFRLSSDDPCDDPSSDWNDISWSSSRSIKDAGIGTDSRTIEIELTTGLSCRPFGIGAEPHGALGNVEVKLSYLHDFDGTTQAVESTTCLANFSSSP